MRPNAAAIHGHITNTRRIDPEVLELRYPVRLEATAVVVSFRRNITPFGLTGGAEGALGRQWVEHRDGSRHVMASTDRSELAPGDVFVIETPGGGGYGLPSG